MYYSDPCYAFKSLTDLVAAEAELHAKFLKDYAADVQSRASWFDWQGVAHLVAAQQASWASKMLALAPEGTGDWGRRDDPTPEMTHWHLVVVSEAFSLLRRFQHVRPASRSTSVSSNLAEDALLTLATTIVSEAGPRVRLELERRMVERMDKEAEEREAARLAAERERLEAESAREAAKREARRQRREARKVAQIYPEGTR